MTDQIKVAIMQLRAHDRDQFSSTSPQLLEKIRRSADHGAQLIVLPEGTFPSYVLGPAPVDNDECHQFITDVDEIAKKQNVIIICGGAKHEHEHEHEHEQGFPENAAVIFSPQSDIRMVGKRFLWHFDRRWFIAGTSLDPIPTPLGRLGILICADGRVPTLARTLVDRGAQILIMPTAWVTSGRDPNNFENPLADLLLPIRAWENDVPIVAANKVGAELGSVLFCGKSQIINEKGMVLQKASQDQEETLYETIVYTPSQPHRSVNAHQALSPTTSSLGMQSCLSSSVRIALAHSLEPRHVEVAGWCEVKLIFSMLAASKAGDLKQSTTDVTTQNTIEPPIQLCAVSDITAGIIQHSALLAYVVVDDDDIADPGSLPRYRQQGIDLFVWRADRLAEPRKTELARARALELRAYLVVLSMDPNERCLAVDPDGVVIAGTTDALIMPQWVYDPQRATTTIAPGTDTMAGLRLVEHLATLGNSVS